MGRAGGVSGCCGCFSTRGCARFFGAGALAKVLFRRAAVEE
jgi:hypothetical protein